MKKAIFLSLVLCSQVLLSQVLQPYAILTETAANNKLDTTSIIWINYTSFGGVNTRTHQNWDTVTKSWINYALENSIYNANDTATVHYYSIWNSSNMKYDSSIRTNTIYNSKGLPYVSITADYDMGNWLTSSIDTFFYNSNDLSELTISYIDQTGSGIVTPVGKWYSYYNNDMKPVLFHGLSYNDNTQTWDSSYKGIHHFYPSPIPDTAYSYYYSATWVKNDKYYSFHDAKGRTIETVRLLWNNTNSVFEKSNQDIYLFNTDDTFHQIISNTWDDTNNQFVINNQRTWLYESAQGLSTINSKIEFKVFPNPAKNEIKVQVPDYLVNSTIQIYSSTIQLKRTVYSINSTTTVDLRGLNPGVYFISIKNKEDVTMKRFVIQ